GDRSGRVGTLPSIATQRAPRIAFGTGGLPGVGRAAGRPIPHIAFGNHGPGRNGHSGRTARRTMPSRTGPTFRPGPAADATGAWLAGATARLGDQGVAVSAGPAGSGAAALAGFGATSSGARRFSAQNAWSRQPKQPRFARSTVGHQQVSRRQPKIARIGTRR